MRRIIIIFSIMLLLSISISFAQEAPLTITDIKAEPSIVNPGVQVLITCRVDHPEGPMFINKVAATVHQDENNTGYPALYDDGTNGDIEPGDGIYSLAIAASNEAGAAQIIFHAVDTEGHEIDSDPISLTIQ